MVINVSAKRVKERRDLLERPLDIDWFNPPCRPVSVVQSANQNRYNYGERQEMPQMNM